MIAARINGTTNVLTAPRGWNEERTAAATRWPYASRAPHSPAAWELTPAELETLKAGGSVVLTVFGGQPPVMLTAANPRRRGLCRPARPRWPLAR